MKPVNVRWAMFVLAMLVGGCASVDTPVSMQGPLVIAEQGYFHAGGRLVQSANGQIMTGQMFVQYQIPQDRRHPYPVVMIHGGGQTGTNFLSTPDGRQGWAEYFLRAGYAVYVVDQAGRARSGFFTEAYGKTRRPNTEAMSNRFTAFAQSREWPQAHLHTQWPGTGRVGDATYERFFASQVEDIADLDLIETLNRDAGAALLERIGPAILLTHSQSGPLGWLIANERPKLVKGIVAVEPSGPPFAEVAFIGAPNWFKDGAPNRFHGITRQPLAFSPAVTSPRDLQVVQQAAPDAPDLVRCRLQAEPARQLVHLAGIPTLIVVSESSYHAPYDHCTARFLTQAGVANDFVRLPQVGIRGNGHMMMLERNNLEVAAFLDGWLRRRVR